MTELRDTIRRAFTSFLALPTAVITLFAALAFGANWLDQAELAGIRPIRDFMRDHVFTNEEATSNLLTVIAGGVITITSITFSLLLLALQQSASSLTADVFDQFLRRRANQVYFGYFIGLTLYALIVLASVDPSFNPVIGATLALILTIAGLYVLLLLIYSTIGQMRPTDIIRSIHDITLQAKERQRPLLMRTRRAGRLNSAPTVVVTAPHEGFIVGIDLDALAAVLSEVGERVEMSYLRSIGSYVAFGDPVAEIRGELEGLDERVRSATIIDRERDVDRDPAFGIEQIGAIAWRSVSTSQHNPAPGIAAVNALHDLLARWSVARDPDGDEPPLPIAYPDNVIETLFDGFESLTVVASEAMQHQIYAAVLNALAMTFERLDPDEQQRAQDLVLRSLSGLGDHMLTRNLDDALGAFARVCERTGAIETASSVQTARNALAESIGQLNSRSTRVPRG